MIRDYRPEMDRWPLPNTDIRRVIAQMSFVLESPAENDSEEGAAFREMVARWRTWLILGLAP